MVGEWRLLTDIVSNRRESLLPGGCDIVSPVNASGCPGLLCYAWDLVRDRRRAAPGWVGASETVGGVFIWLR